jgi:hypothetical protein
MFMNRRGFVCGTCLPSAELSGVWAYIPILAYLDDINADPVIHT